MQKFTVIAASLLLAPGLALAGNDQTTGTAQTTTSTTTEVDVEARQAELDRMASEAIARLTAESPTAASVHEKAYGYAVFDATKGGAIVTGAGGSGVAVTKDGIERTYMHMGSAGVGLGLGGQSYHLVLMFEDQQSFDKFVDGRWDASTTAQAAAGKRGVNAASSFVDGVALYQLTDKGLMAQADITGTKFWPSDSLNESEVEEAE